jgi:hypothetical protein
MSRARSGPVVAPAGEELVLDYSVEPASGTATLIVSRTFDAGERADAMKQLLEA